MKTASSAMNYDAYPFNRDAPCWKSWAFEVCIRTVAHQMEDAIKTLDVVACPFPDAPWIFAALIRRPEWESAVSKLTKDAKTAGVPLGLPMLIEPFRDGVWLVMFSPPANAEIPEAALHWETSEFVGMPEF